MRSWLFVFLIACGGGPKPAPAQPDQPPPPPADKPAMMASGDTQPACPDPMAINCILDTIDYFQRSMCSCKDKACADGVNEKMSKWGQDMANKGDGPKPSEADTKRVTESVTKYAECMTKLMGSEQAIPDPCGGGDPCGD